MYVFYDWLMISLCWKNSKISDMLFKCLGFMIEFMIFYDEIYDFWTAWPQ